MWIRNLSPFLVQPNDPVRRVIETIDRNEMQIALVVDDGGHLLGTITDGDIRRGLLGGLTLEQSAREVMFTTPQTGRADQEPSAVDALMHRIGLWRIPVLDEAGRLVALAVPDAQLQPRRDNLVVLMAGGLGTRLGELTRNTPKPLLQVGNRPILQTILECFISQGFYRFMVSVNYKGELIEEYFGDGSDWGVEINYLRENRRLGTAGALALMERAPREPVIVMNADLLTRVDFRQMLDFHSSHGFDATMAVRAYDVQVPFGVVELSDQHVTRLVEKPLQRHFINAGIYVLEPHCVERVPKGDFYDMTTLFTDLLLDHRPVGSFPIHEYWQDVGRPDDFHTANMAYAEVFDNLAEH